MGRNNETFKTFLQHEEPTWSPYRRGLRTAEEKAAFDRLFTCGHIYSAESTAAARPVPLEALLMSILLAQEIRIGELERTLENLQERETEIRPA